jgi:hypothetical protein
METYIGTVFCFNIYFFLTAPYNFLVVQYCGLINK